jgi:hypothetical protein
MASDHGMTPEREAELAKAAIVATLRRIRAQTPHVVDPRAWARTHPWATLGLTAVFGLAAGKTLSSPSRIHRLRARITSRLRRRRAHGASQWLGWLLSLGQLFGLLERKHRGAPVHNGRE